MSPLFPQVPFLQVKGPLLVVQLLETTLLCLVNYARYFGMGMIPKPLEDGEGQGRDLRGTEQHPPMQREM